MPGYEFVVEDVIYAGPDSANLIKFSDTDLGGVPAIPRAHYKSTRRFERLFITAPVNEITLIIVTECVPCLDLPEVPGDTGDPTLILTSGTLPSSPAPGIAINTLYLFSGNTKLQTICTFPEEIDRANIDRDRGLLIASSAAGNNLYWVDY
ncbi:MAG: hypothetical protein KDK27_20100, partial [Leptospiraceae bacterium]|nr:hypothetical protein [Leptospiraceae bacterium]